MAARSALLGAAGPALKLAVLTLLMCTATGMASFFDFVSDTASSAVDTVGDTVQEAVGDCGDAEVLCRIPIASIDSEVRLPKPSRLSQVLLGQLHRMMPYMLNMCSSLLLHCRTCPGVAEV